MIPEPEEYTPLNVPTSGPVNIPVQTPPTPPTTAPTLTDRKLRRLFPKSWFIVVIGLILIITLLRGYYLYSQTQKPKSPDFTSPIPTLQPPITPTSETPTDTTTADWQTYQTSEYSFKYPQNWTKADTTPSNPNLSFINQPKSVGIMISPFRPGFGVGGPNDPVENSQIDVVVSNKTYHAEETTTQSQSLGFLILDIPNYTITAGSHSIIPGVTGQTSYQEYLNNRSTILQILSTFKFTE